MCLVAIAAIAQETADIEVSYIASCVNLRDGSNITPNQYILLANNRESKFYSPITEYIDSLQSTPTGAAKYKDITGGAYESGKADEVPRRDGSYYIFKTIPDRKLKYYDMNGTEKYFYEEDIPQVDWELVNSTKNILGYECQMATGNLHGRKWTVWFTSEVPVMNGPWKFGGLPGLILEATDDSGLYNFTANGIQKTSRPIVSMYSAGDYEKISRIDFLKAKRSFIDNPMGFIKAQFEGDVTTLSLIDENGHPVNENKPIYAAREEVDFIETDY